ncbi:uncharacterized protein LOC125841549 [Solanum stenotomum]|uniref:uncharacterized protein LOC125841549 n=1 Tax=Solanum stenotomum TaxID=172797 RepID=UPI0020D1AE3A|nr:uncharacterized protein LOC125841549 [Solanum stenotomum]
MSNLSKLEFVALDISEKNYLSWVLDAEIHLTAKGLGDSIIEGNKVLSQDKAKAMIFLCQHLDENLKVEYLIVKDSLELWVSLKGKYDHLKATHNDLLMKNHVARLVGSSPLPEAHGQSEIRQSNRGHDNVCGRGKGKRRYNNRRGGGYNKRENNIGSQNNPSKGKGDHCHRCGLKGHWKNECRVPEHFVRLYQNSFKRKGNKGGASSSNARVESHLTLKDDAQAGSSKKYDENIEASLALKDDVIDELNNITHLEAEKTSLRITIED